MPFSIEQGSKIIRSESSSDTTVRDNLQIWKLTLVATILKSLK